VTSDPSTELRVTVRDSNGDEQKKPSAVSSRLSGGTRIGITNAYREVGHKATLRHD